MNYFRFQLVMVPFYFFFELEQKDGQAQPGLSMEWCFGSRTVKTKEKKNDGNREHHRQGHFRWGCVKTGFNYQEN